MEFNIQCADPKTGLDRIVTLEAASEGEAEEKAAQMGLLVNAVFPRMIKDEDDDEEEGEIALDPEPVPPVRGRNVRRPVAEPTEPPAAPPGRPRNSTLAAPEYLGLQVADVVLRILAFTCFPAGFITFFVFLDWFKNYGFYQSYFLLLIAFGAVMLGAILHGMSASCEALRDLARNSFGK